MAEVYRASLDGENVAIKAMPITKDHVNDSEIEIAKYLSDSKSKYFPQVYLSTRCSNIVFQRPEFTTTSSLYKLRKAVVAVNNQDTHRRFMALTNSSESHDAVLFQAQSMGLHVPSQVSHTGMADILVSALAQCDLKQWRHKTHTFEEWMNVLRLVYMGIDDMQRKNVLHNDLHEGNILLKGDEVWIHDFGKSEIRKQWTRLDRVMDVETFHESIRQMDSVHRKIRRVITDAQDIVDEHSDGSPLMPSLIQFVTKINE